MIELDGAQGEGGGQILRSALTLSMITGQPFRMINIRANRPKPGLMRQHLAAVQASARISGADVSGAEAGSLALRFAPGPIRGGDYAFAIGTAGSCTLVLQTLLPALLHADGPATISISGGTHNSMAPPLHFLQRAYGRVLGEMGARIDIQLKRFGFYPAGGGEVLASIAPCAQLRPFELLERGARRHGYAESFIAGVPANVATRELAVIGSGMGWTDEQLLHRGLPGEQGPGNALLLTLDHEHVTEVFAGFGEKAVRAETVAKHVLQEARAYLASGAAVGEHLADQLMLPMALAGGGCFTTNVLSSHATTNAGVISRFLPVRFHFEHMADKIYCQLNSAHQL
ncbi:RNA 3'-terminal phosphate cyclase (ATP) [Duganella sp. SG902]|uniref:RNA 3'-terminal phosphate cyclase n=1 Tax=Duganella sp. SG902 TaxID=2587016 RepID=UPI00159D723A|nr:RNA 3'-terminal phosphate cyclase [Duganella sp. SG902]NVM76692.1 RNA 3'-terminal phosphate cyclase (ATP) [Duganella sp. SG902]